jgi:cis-L-3-hydroxyproline dehydratase
VSEVSGRLIVTSEPLSFWGGYDPLTGVITDRTHPLLGVKVAGAVLALPETRGSSTTTAVLLEAIHAGTAPVALLTRGVDAFLSLAAVVAQEMYGVTVPVVALEVGDFDCLQERVRGAAHASVHVRIRADHTLEFVSDVGTGTESGPESS